MTLLTFAYLPSLTYLRLLTLLAPTSLRYLPSRTYTYFHYVTYLCLLTPTSLRYLPYLPLLHYVTYPSLLTPTFITLLTLAYLPYLPLLHYVTYPSLLTLITPAVRQSKHFENTHLETTQAQCLQLLQLCSISPSHF